MLQGAVHPRSAGPFALLLQRQQLRQCRGGARGRGGLRHRTSEWRHDNESADVYICATYPKQTTADSIVCTLWHIVLPLAFVSLNLLGKNNLFFFFLSVVIVFDGFHFTPVMAAVKMYSRVIHINRYFPFLIHTTYTTRAKRNTWAADVIMLPACRCDALVEKGEYF